MHTAVNIFMTFFSFILNSHVSFRLQHPKQHITEERMAEHMSRLHISSETAACKETDTNRQQRLYMCEEMRKLQADSIIPPSLFSKMNEPCKALVLWKPPTRYVLTKMTFFLS